MEEFTKEKIIKEKWYKAIDGTEFTSEEECAKYENSARAVLFTKYNSLVVKSGSEYEFFGFGCDDNIIDVVKIEKPKDVDIILQLEALLYSNPNLEHSEKILEEALVKGTKVLIFRGYNEEEFSVWIGKTEIFDKINKIFE